MLHLRWVRHLIRSSTIPAAAEHLLKSTVTVKCLGTSSSVKVTPQPRRPETKKKKITGQLFNERDINFSTLDPDKFGDLVEQYRDSSSRGPLKAEDTKDDADGYDKLEIKRGVKKSIPAYMRIFNELRREKPPNVPKMLQLHQQFIYEDRYIPEKTLYSILINACARVGFTRKAVQLFEEMKRFELKPTKSAVTGLFNACANCSHTAEYGLKQALQIREQLQLAGYEFNDIQYNVMIKAFARLGDMATARTTLQEMTDKGHTVSLETYSMLLMGCISNKNAGLLEGTRMMHRMLQSGSSIDLPVINLFLRCIRDCEISQEDVLQISSSQFIATSNSNRNLQLIESGLTVTDPEKVPSQLELMTATPSYNLIERDDSLPNLLTGANLNQIISIDFASLSRPANRFLLFGGVQGFVKLMDSNGIKPSLKTITMFVDLMHPKEALAQMRLLLERYHLKADIYLYNVLLKKVAKTGSQVRCREILSAMANDSIEPDIMTFGALTFACFDTKPAKRLLSDMFKCGIVPNAQIIGSLVNIACSSENLDYVSFMLDHIERNQLPLTKLTVEQVDLLLKKTRQLIVSNERKDIPIGTDFKMNYERILARFADMLKASTIEVGAHPWTQFEPAPRANPKAKYHAVVKMMQRKTDIKLRREKPREVDYNDEIDD